MVLIVILAGGSYGDAQPGWIWRSRDSRSRDFSEHVTAFTLAPVAYIEISFFISNPKKMPSLCGAVGQPTARICTIVATP
jgi:hypothetical protein